MSYVDGTENAGVPGPATVAELARQAEEEAIWRDAGGGMSLRERGEWLNPQPPDGPLPPGMIDG